METYWLLGEQSRISVSAQAPREKTPEPPRRQSVRSISPIIEKMSEETQKGLYSAYKDFNNGNECVS